MNSAYAKGVSQSRKDSNKWLRKVAKGIKGNVLSIGSGDDLDGTNTHYRDYFIQAKSYTTSEFIGTWDVDEIIDVCDMKNVADGKYDCVFVSGVLEHVPELWKAVNEIKRIIKKGGTLLLGVPFRQHLHGKPYDYWRFTRYTLEYLFSDFTIEEIKEIDTSVERFPSAYWFKGLKI